jgi:hypothetical protein
MKDNISTPAAQKTREWPAVPLPSRRPYTCFFILALSFSTDILYLIKKRGGDYALTNFCNFNMFN